MSVILYSLIFSDLSLQMLEKNWRSLLKPQPDRFSPTENAIAPPQPDRLPSTQKRSHPLPTQA
ncbi:hypothetical protein [Merismopedia glauca]|uniref:Uncharacterized protein n=1 Tax=Merismopedia glauca CCAP 1448/3 TaxID=1296344 RepID=A0A2T1C7Q6_9CYAN|nr:hypothetical protein [Merismopedia glauca]PSB04264.1 hypothetical protein C7B64_04705 [Merismopedia glauca CCAP 1448/3]